ncbi:MAG: PASTA domain-containing protein, partial [Spirochaetales bacterium]|nr:PASTA domain-containing protein [Spirochaetales bacterium]MCF7937333.1 PASTA domain-containing protein [Spirochaetales bacterium]
GLTELEFVVSKGPEPEMFTLQDYRGIPFDQAMLMLAEKDIPFLVEVGEVEEDEDVQDGIVLKQEPPRGTGLEQGEAVELTISKPEDLADNEVFGILEYELPDYPILVDLSYSVISDTGERREVFTMKHPGGTISIPYIEKIGSLLTISIFDREIIQRTVRPKSTESEANQPASNPEQPESVLPESE